MVSPQRYDTIGRGYTTFRQPDPRIEAQIWTAVGDASRIVNVGAGTGSYERFDRNLVAVEPSAVMVRQRDQRVPVVRASAEALPFPDNSFDVVMAQYVVTAVPNPEAAMDEFARVLRPGGEIILLSRVSADAGLRRFIEQRLQPVVRQLGFRTDFAWSRYTQWAARAHGVELVERRPVPPLGHFSLIRFRKAEAAVAA